MELSHFSYKPIDALYSVEQDARDNRYWNDKPRGFWVSVDGKNDWEEWCNAENFGKMHKTYQYRVELAPDANILHISNEDEFMAFHKEYSKDAPEVIYGGVILWENVAKNYQGIIIAPYLYTFRFHDQTRWYYGWDCASGCIWNADAIAGIELIREPEKEYG